MASRLPSAERIQSEEVKCINTIGKTTASTIAYRGVIVSFVVIKTGCKHPTDYNLRAIRNSSRRRVPSAGCNNINDCYTIYPEIKVVYLLFVSLRFGFSYISPDPSASGVMSRIAIIPFCVGVFSFGFPPKSAKVPFPSQPPPIKRDLVYVSSQLT